ncbi:MAG: ABC transporter ATP-binding protein, partial [Ardenticatenaceae bacterium]
ITHKLDEVMRFADRVTVLREGRVIATHDSAQPDKAALVREMVGREVLFQPQKEAITPGPVVLALRGVHATGSHGLPALRDVSFDVRSGEILGVAGVAGNGQQELAEIITRLRPVAEGQMWIGEREITHASPLDAIRAGVGHIPADRLGMGLAGNMTVADNLIMKGYRREPLSNGQVLSPRAIRGYARRLVDLFRIATPSVRTPVRTLSGGNLQKAILARELDAAPRLLVAVHPTRGLDIGAMESVHQHLLAQRSAGTAILLISEDLDELLVLADRIAVLYEGRIMGIVDAEAAEVEEIGLMMAGESIQAD